MIPPPFMPYVEIAALLVVKNREELQRRLFNIARDTRLGGRRDEPIAGLLTRFDNATWPEAQAVAGAARKTLERLP